MPSTNPSPQTSFPHPTTKPNSPSFQDEVSATFRFPKAKAASIASFANDRPVPSNSLRHQGSIPARPNASALPTPQAGASNPFINPHIAIPTNSEPFSLGSAFKPRLNQPFGGKYQNPTARFDNRTTGGNQKAMNEMKQIMDLGEGGFPLDSTPPLSHQPPRHSFNPVAVRPIATSERLSDPSLIASPLATTKRVPKDDSNLPTKDAISKLDHPPGRLDGSSKTPAQQYQTIDHTQKPSSSTATPAIISSSAPSTRKKSQQHHPKERKPANPRGEPDWTTVAYNANEGRELSTQAEWIPSGSSTQSRPAKKRSRADQSDGGDQLDDYQTDLMSSVVRVQKNLREKDALIEKQVGLSLVIKAMCMCLLVCFFFFYLAS